MQITTGKFRAVSTNMLILMDLIAATLLHGREPQRGNSGVLDTILGGFECT